MSLAHRFLSGAGKEVKDRKKLFIAVFALALGITSGYLGYIYFFGAAKFPTRVFPKPVAKPRRAIPKPLTLNRTENVTVAVSNGTKVVNKKLEKEPKKTKTFENKTVVLQKPKKNILKAATKKKESKRIARAKRKLTIRRNTTVSNTEAQKSAKILYLLEEATKAFKKKDYAGAIRGYLEVLKLDPGNKKALLNLGVLYFQIGRVKDARRLFEKLLKIQPDNVDALNNLAVIALEEERYKDALSLLDRCLKVDPVNRTALLNKALCFKRLGDAEEALEILHTGRKLYPNDYRFYLYIGMIFYQKGDVEQAFYNLEKAYRLVKGKDPEVERYLRRILER